MPINNVKALVSDVFGTVAGREVCSCQQKSLDFSCISPSQGLRSVHCRATRCNTPSCFCTTPDISRSLAAVSIAPCFAKIVGHITLLINPVSSSRVKNINSGDTIPD